METKIDQQTPLELFNLEAAEKQLPSVEIEQGEQDKLKDHTCTKLKI